MAAAGSSGGAERGRLQEVPRSRLLTLAAVADEFSARIVAIFTNDRTGRRPVFGSIELFQRDAAWRDLHADTGAGLGASHQTGWSGLVADLIATRGLRSGGRIGP